MGGIEAEAVMLGQPISMVIPEVVGFRMTGALPQVATATDLVLTVTKACSITDASPRLRVNEGGLAEAARGGRGG